MTSSSSLISKLKNLIEANGSKRKIEGYEDVVVDEIEKYAKEESFYELPTKEILKIIGKSEIDDVELLCEVISRMSESKGEESTLLLNAIKREEATLEDCIKILSKFEHSPVCQRTSKLFNDDKDLAEKDNEHEIKELQKKVKEKKTYFSPVTKKPPDFEFNIHKAAFKWKLTSV